MRGRGTLASQRQRDEDEAHPCPALWATGSGSSSRNCGVPVRSGQESLGLGFPTCEMGCAKRAFLEDGGTLREVMTVPCQLAVRLTPGSRCRGTSLAVLPSPWAWVSPSPLSPPRLASLIITSVSLLRSCVAPPDSHLFEMKGSWNFLKTQVLVGRWGCINC